MQAEALGATRRIDGSWLIAYVQAELSRCRKCLARLGNGGGSPYPFFIDAPNVARVCHSCNHDGKYAVVRAVPEELRLEPSEVFHLGRVVERRRYWRMRDLKRASKVKDARRRAEVSAAIAQLGDVYAARFAAFMARKESWWLTCDEDAFDQILANVEPPTIEIVRDFLDLSQRRFDVRGLVSARMSELGDRSYSWRLDLALQWLCGSGDPFEEQERDDLMSWADEIALANETVDEFLRELRKPTMGRSIAFYDCAASNCRRIPALLCMEVRRLPATRLTAAESLCDSLHTSALCPRPSRAFARILTRVCAQVTSNLALTLPALSS